jgi:Carboxypeptidase regulatory-like domain/Protein of unknown function (DUF1416)
VKIALRKRWLTVAMAALLVVVIAPSAPANAVPGGTVSGHLSDGGTPVPGVLVRLQPLTSGLPFPSTTTNASGAFSFVDVAVSRYYVSFVMPGGSSFYANGAVSFPDADPIDVQPAGAVTVEESVPAHGSMHGRVSRPDGTAAPFTSVNTSGGPAGGGNTSTDASGNYTFPYVWPGTYRMTFFPQGAPIQYAHGTTDLSAATLFPVAAGESVTVDETLLATGTVTGRVTSQDAPAAFASLGLLTTTGSQVATGSTGADGTYRISAVPGTYVLRLRMPNGITQYAHQKTDLASADRFVVVVGETVVVDEQALTPSTIRGTLLRADGTPASGLQVFATDGQNHNYSAGTGPDGKWQMSVLPGTYTIRFSGFTIGNQWAVGKSSAEAANQLVVGEGATVVVDDQLVPAGTLTVTARDKRSGEAIQSFCLFLLTNVCTTTGTATASALPGHYRASVSATDQVYLTESFEVDLVSGQNTALTVDLTKSGTVTAVVKDAATGTPVANACLELVEPLRPMTLGAGGSVCSGPDGAITLRGRRPGIYNAFVTVRDNVHGDQWVGLTKGVGAQARARLIVLNEGATIALPEIKLDLAGTITGFVRDEAGQPLANAYVGVTSSNAGFGPSGVYTNTDANGRYTLTGLGPYSWVLFFGHFGQATVFSGGTGDRFFATGIKLTAGGTTAYDQTMRTGTTFNGTVRNPDGSLRTAFTRITLIHALSGDELGAFDLDSTGTYSFHVAGPLLVKLMINQDWVGGADFLHAQVFLVQPSGTTTANITTG